MAGRENERQERVFIQAITTAVKKSGKVTILAGTTKIENVVWAEKVKDRTEFGHENYADVILHIEGGTELRIQLKNIRTPNLGGGGEKGVKASLPGLYTAFLKRAFAYVLRDLKIKPGEPVPNLYYKLTPHQQLVLLRGSPQIGGPIDYILTGPMELPFVSTRFGLMFHSSSLQSIDAYSRDKTLYMLYKRRSSDQMFDPKVMGALQVPKIHGVGRQGGSTYTGGRLYLVEDIPYDANIIKGGVD